MYFLQIKNNIVYKKRKKKKATTNQLKQNYSRCSPEEIK